MIVYVGGQPINLTPASRIGGGGQGDVFTYGKYQVVKVYFKPTSTLGNKLTMMIQRPIGAPENRSTRPLTLVTDHHGGVVGCVSNRIPMAFSPLSDLASNKYRKGKNVTTEEIAKLFMDGWKTVTDIHNSNYCIGDFSNSNEQFQGTTMLFLDVDDYQVGPFPCSMGTEETLTPRLYNVDLKAAPQFMPNDDWYSFAVLLFRSMLMAHPYGGVHPTAKTLLKRAQQHLFVLGSGITYPIVALSPDLLSDDLLDVFWKYFSEGKDFVFPYQSLENYANNLAVCTNCGATFPASRRACPICSEAHTVILSSPAVPGFSSTTVMLVDNVLYSQWSDHRLNIISEKDGELTLSQWQVQPKQERPQSLGRHKSDVRYVLFGDNSEVSNARGSNQLLFDDRVLETDLFGKYAMFRSNGRYLFRIASGALMYGEYREGGRYVERMLRSTMPDQTWFTVHNDWNEVPSACGFFQVFRQQQWWVIFEGRIYDNLSLTPLEVGEVQKDVFVRMDSSSAIIWRQTEKAGKPYIHRAFVGLSGIVTNDHPLQTDEPLPHGGVYAHQTLLYPTDQGIVSYRKGVIKQFAQTAGIVDTDTTLYVLDNDLIAVRSDQVIRIHI